MLSNKMTFSLMSLITIIALAFVTPFAAAGVLGDKFATTITLRGSFDSTTDLLTVIGDNDITAPLGDNVAQTGNISLRVVFGKRVFAGPNADADADPPVPAGRFAPEDVTVAAFNKTTGATVTPNGIAIKSPFENPWTEFDVALGDIAVHTVVLVTIAEGAVENYDAADVIKAGTSDDTLGGNAKATLQFEVLPPAPADAPTPRVVSVTDLPGAVIAPGNPDAFSFTVTLSEKPKEFKKGHIDVGDHATVDTDPIALAPVQESAADQSTEASNRLYPYLVTVTPKYESKDDIVIKIKSFEDLDTPTARKSLVTIGYAVKVLSDANKEVGLSGIKVELPKDIVIPADGYLVVVRSKADSLIVDPGDPKHGAADIARRDKANKQTYNMIESSGGGDLEGFLIRGGTIDLVSPNAGLVISEIMWATDGGDPKRQWVEIANTSGAEIKTSEKDNATRFMVYEASEALPDMTDETLNIQDRVSTLYKGTNHWSIAGKGQSGRTVGKIVEEKKAGGGDTENIAIDIEIVPTDRLISMERAMAADGTYADGTMASSWAQSMPPSQNFVDAAGGLFVGSPGTAPITPVEVVDPEPEPTPAPVAMPEDIMITEIMVDTGDGRLPQWIELTNVSGAEVSLAGWSLQITNPGDDDEVIGSSVSIDLSGTLGVGGGEDAGGTMGKSLLLVAGAARSSSNLAGSDRVVDISSQVDQRGRYALISSTAFMIALVPPQETGVLKYGDIAGNLGADEAWDIPMSEGGRSSLIRREMLDDGMATMGTAPNGWVLASGTALVSGPTTWYGSDEDAGTPGYDAGGPLPVELSHFRPARDKQTGAVVITWATQSELNNAGFFIKRSQQRDGQFQVINATMVPGAGTTSEKQFYTYTDTTAQPNIVYYYQIEDVSLDGNRQTLTHGIRLKGHIGAAGKLTSTWGELKSSNE